MSFFPLALMRGFSNNLAPFRTILISSPYSFTTIAEFDEIMVSPLLQASCPLVRISRERLPNPELVGAPLAVFHEDSYCTVEASETTWFE